MCTYLKHRFAKGYVVEFVYALWFVTLIMLVLYFAFEPQADFNYLAI
jgi:hypothetical protein